jgi:ornithine racemase
VIILGILEINLDKIQNNAKILTHLFAKKGISIIGVTKLVLSDLSIVNSLIQGGMKFIADSYINNIIEMKENQVNAEFVLIRVPSLKEIPLVVEYVDYSINSELQVIRKLSEESIKQKKIHKIILMIDMGDSREGINPTDIDWYVKRIIKLKNIRLSGIGTNWKCFGGVIPTEKNMKKFSDIVKRIQRQYKLKLDFISGGNSANYNWFMSCDDIGEINNLRIGEALFLGKETINYQKIPNLYTDAFTLIAEIVEIKQRLNNPQGVVMSNAFGEKMHSPFQSLKNEGEKCRKQALLNIGRQDIVEKGIKPRLDIKILGASSNYLIVDIKNNDLRVGSEISFELNYEALLRAMTNPFIHKKYIIS